MKDFYFTIPSFIGNGMTHSRNIIERRNEITDEEPIDLRSGTWGTRHMGLEGIEGRRGYCAFFLGI